MEAYYDVTKSATFDDAWLVERRQIVADYSTKSGALRKALKLNAEEGAKPKTKPQQNLFRVQKKTWNKWSEEARRIFNVVYRTFRVQGNVRHPDQPKMPADHWKTIRWNSAWLAADATNHPEVKTYEIDWSK